MSQYVAMSFSHDGELGPTILCDSWQQAVAQCVQIAAENGHALTNEEVKIIDGGGSLRMDGGCTFYTIGGLESPMEED